MEIISCNAPSRIKPSIDRIEYFIKRGYFAAGFLSYEAGFGLEEALKAKRGCNFPLLWFGIFRDPEKVDHSKILFNDDISKGGYRIKDIEAEVSRREYINSIEKIKAYIEKGDTYQVNHTFKLNFFFSGSITDLYLHLRRKQSVSYSALIKFNEKYILSFSPELFFKRKNEFIQVKPMKGTADRGRLLREDRDNAKLLYLCPKNRSENIMIVDLLRNDLSRISKKGTVKTKRFFEVEKYESLFQMTSTVVGKARAGLSLYELFKATFPSGSVTGAPKISSMKIIDELEKSPRQIYTGSIGFLSPNRESAFNVAIRTLLIDTQKKIGEMGIGSGIVYDSDPKKEHAECILKAKFLTEKTRNFSLIETLLWEPNKGYPLLKFHLDRLSESAKYFDYKYNKKRITVLLNKLSNVLGDNSYRVRLLLDKSGGISIARTIIRRSGDIKLIAFSPKMTDSADRFLFHKTTNRKIYDNEYKKYKKQGFFDVIFRNKKNEVTEGAISNIFIKKGDRYYTPPVECGLLNGVYRRYLISEKILKIEEKVLNADDIRTADKIILTNAVHGIVAAKLHAK
jgi:para-aminobenzoate synthetase/4-amino-4-deoxychorismate lyase